MLDVFLYSILLQLFSNKLSRLSITKSFFNSKTLQLLYRPHEMRCPLRDNFSTATKLITACQV
jgi:hypothetical protein